MKSEIEGAFERVFGQPSWGVRNTLGSFLILNFGQPGLAVHEPKPNPRTGRLTRLVVSRGTDHLWIQQAAWSLTRDGVEFAHSQTPGHVLDTVLRDELAGQALVKIVSNGGCCDFVFDLGTVLHTWPLPGDEGPDPTGEWPAMWSLYSDPGRVLTCFGNGGTHVGEGADARGTAPSDPDSGVGPPPA